MKKLIPFLVAAALAMPVFGAAAHHAFAQDGGTGPGCAGHHEGGGRGHHGHGGRGGRHGNPAEHVEERARMMTAMLDLDARQQTEVRRILTAEAAQMQTLMQQGRSEATHTAMRALHEQTKQSISVLLNPTQRATMERVEAARRANHEGRGHGPNAAPTPPATH